MEWEHEGKKGGSLNMAEWKTPKIDWKATDRFNFSDYNRIKNNLSYLRELAIKIWEPFEITDMGEDMISYDSYWDVNVFNAFEANIDIINEHMFTMDYGIRQVFYQNGIFIQYSELNRIEETTLKMKQIIEGWEAGLARLPFRLGGPKGLYL